MSNYKEYVKLLIELNKWHDNHIGLDGKEDQKYYDLVDKIENLIENKLTDEEIEQGDKLTSYLNGYSDGKKNDRAAVDVAKAVGKEDERSDDAHRAEELLILQFELYEQGLDDYCSEVEEVESELSGLMDDLNYEERHAADTLNVYLIGFKHAIDGRPRSSFKEE